jgi:hypothetical protein
LALYRSSPSSVRNIMSQADVDFVLVEKDSPRLGIQADDLSNDTDLTSDQDAADHDVVIVPEMLNHLSPEFPSDHHDAFNELDVDELLFSREAALASIAAPDATPTTPNVREVLRLVENDQKIEETLERIKAGQTLSASEAEQALDALKEMSVEDRTRLFS